MFYLTQRISRNSNHTNNIPFRPAKYSYDYSGYAEFENGVLPHVVKVMKANPRETRKLVVNAAGVEKDIYIIATIGDGELRDNKGKTNLYVRTRSVPAEALHEQLQGWLSRGARGKAHAGIDDAVNNVERAPIAWLALNEAIFMTFDYDTFITWCRFFETPFGVNPDA
jgi:hypothetical protein